MKDSYITIAWLVLLIILLIIEIITVGLTSIWAAGGALAALVLNLLDISLLWQVVVFFIVTFVLLYFTRPFAIRFINTRREKTNYEGIIGKTIRIAETVDNISQTGMAVVNGAFICRKAGNLTMPPLYLRAHTPASIIHYLSLCFCSMQGAS